MPSDRRLAERAVQLVLRLPGAVRLAQLRTVGAMEGAEEAVLFTDSGWQYATDLLDAAHHEGPGGGVELASDRVVREWVRRAEALIVELGRLDREWVGWWAQPENQRPVARSPLRRDESPLAGRWDLVFRSVAGTGPPLPGSEEPPEVAPHGHEGPRPVGAAEMAEWYATDPALIYLSRQGDMDATLASVDVCVEALVSSGRPDVAVATLERLFVEAHAAGDANAIGRATWCGWLIAGLKSASAPAPVPRAAPQPLQTEASSGTPGGVHLFARDVRPVGDQPDDPGGAHQVVLAERWNVGRTQNGGVLLATVAGMLADIAGQPHPLALTGHFLGATSAGEAIIEGTVVKPGRTYATAQGSLSQGGRERVRALGAFGDLAGRATAGPSYFETAAPTLPAPDRCDDLFEILTATVGARALTRSLQNFEIRTAPGGGWGGPGGDEPRLEGWVRFREAATVTPLMVVALADGFPPSLLGHVEMGWLPTVELTVHLFGAPPADEPWLRARLRTRSVVGGLLDEDGELWDGAGRLVARFRQMAMLIPRDD
ncbi:MAG: hypothetical protein NVSMB16_06070 [Acidimicrobiales bacterium]